MWAAPGGGTFTHVEVVLLLGGDVRVIVVRGTRAVPRLGVVHLVSHSPARNDPVVLPGGGGFGYLVKNRTAIFDGSERL